MLYRSDVDSTPSDSVRHAIAGCALRFGAGRSEKDPWDLPRVRLVAWPEPDWTGACRPREGFGEVHEDVRSEFQTMKRRL